jgi:chromosome segregation ATPase
MARNWDAEMRQGFEKLTETVGMFGKQLEVVTERLDGVEAQLHIVDQRLDAVDQRLDAVDRRFDAVDQRFDAVDQRFDAMDQRLDGVDQRLDGVDQRLDGVDRRLVDMNDAMEVRHSRLLDAFKVESERVREAIAKAAEGYGATLQRIERTLDESQRDWQQRFALHDRALKNHARRITALERAKKA